MYKTILVTLDSTPSDRAIIEHVKTLARLAQSRVVLLHVADGFGIQVRKVDHRDGEQGQHDEHDEHDDERCALLQGGRIARATRPNGTEGAHDHPKETSTTGLESD